MGGLEHYRSEVATVGLDATVRELVDAMARLAIGCVVVTDADGQPLGIVTDRDLACRVIAQGRDPDATRASEVMSKPLITAAPGDALEHVIERMRSGAVRRVPIVREGRLVGLVALDDVLVLLARELDDLGEAVRREIDDARRLAHAERRRERVEETLREVRGQVEQVGQDAREVLAREIEALRERIRRLLS